MPENNILRVIELIYVSKLTTEIEKYIPALRRYAFALLRNQEAADDLVQDCLERALQKQLLWLKGSSMRAWLFTIMHNIYVNQVKKQSRKPVTFSLDTYHDTHDISAGYAHSDSNISDIEKGLHQLPEEQRQVLLLVALEGFSYKEVSKILNIPMGTVMSRLSRARESVRSFMRGK